MNNKNNYPLFLWERELGFTAVITSTSPPLNKILNEDELIFKYIYKKLV